MNPLLKTVVGLGSGWVAQRGLTVVSRLQAGHGETVAKKLSALSYFIDRLQHGGGDMDEILEKIMSDRKK